ncbi:lytic transglycosylase domain-containing protein [Jiella sonneratiae]|uniref:Lytic transglycosylase domain-containing protein n=1 Tax=Jiella sonneratiae TaxID=2816856 RepID=A0ABS3J5W1_9HYPH|nr:lytic transglycosylase domain-containing protein [Jiella sonneratiae]MBO0905057.1 lytic transglycosylase domain-containing protein [Jiella sonneratiae]
MSATGGTDCPGTRRKRRRDAAPAKRPLLAALLALAAALAPPGGPQARADPLRLGGDAATALPALAYPPSPPRLHPPADVPGETAAADDGEEENDGDASAVKRICSLIAANADAVGMPRSFFARLIWKESRFDAKAVSPVGAQGIAQFMPYTAAERGLSDPYDTAEAIRHSALFLADLRSELGNWGLAAAAYNGGINRVKRWIAVGGQLPFETESYVAAITFRPADWFREDGREIEPRPLEEGEEFEAACEKLPVMKSRAIFASVESAPMRPWGAQVAGNPSQSVAMAMFRRVKSAHPAIFGDEKPIVLRQRAPGRGRIWAVRIGADSRAEANAFCTRLQGAGGSCIVLKNR